MVLLSNEAIRYSEGILALWHGYKTYNHKQDELGTFLNYQIRYRLIDLIHKKSREMEIDKRGSSEEQLKTNLGNRHRTTNNSIPDIRGVFG